MTNLERAMMVAGLAHTNQTYDMYPYTYHIKSVIEIAQELGYDHTIQVACALHDAIEDDGVSYNDIKRGFGEEVAEIVFAVTDELGRNRVERKMKTYPKIKANWKATVVKICDRIANASHSKEYSPKKFTMYQDEHEDFMRNLMLDSHPQNEVKKAWDKLNRLMRTNEVAV